MTNEQIKERIKHSQNKRKSTSGAKNRQYGRFASQVQLALRTLAENQQNR